MEYNSEYFDAGIYRMGTRSEKWDFLREREGRDILPLWVADMDFPSPPEVQQALLIRAAHGTYGYTEATDEDYAAVSDFWRRRHGLEIAREDMLMIPCVITGMRLAILAATEENDGVVIMPPVYGPFAGSVKATGRTRIDVPLLEKNGGWRIDFSGLERALENGARCVLFCNPHNPVGRLWTREEMQKLAELCDAYGATLISDEIHADFALDGRTVPVLSLRSAKTVSLCAASKTFNLAGLQQAMCFCRDEELRGSIVREIEKAGVRSGNEFALDGTRAAYDYGDAWLNGLLDYLRGSRDELKKLVAEYAPKARLAALEATYLAWLDLRAYGFDCEELARRCTAAGVAFTEGTFFGSEGEGFLRVNIACPRRYLREGMRRLGEALK